MLIFFKIDSLALMDNKDDNLHELVQLVNTCHHIPDDSNYISKVCKLLFEEMKRFETNKKLLMLEKVNEYKAKFKNILEIKSFEDKMTNYSTAILLSNETYLPGYDSYRRQKRSTNSHNQYFLLNMLLDLLRTFDFQDVIILIDQIQDKSKHFYGVNFCMYL